MEILKEYLTISNEISKLKGHIFDIRDKFQQEIQLASTDEEKRKLFEEYTQNIDSIKNDEFMEQYKLLKNRRDEIIRKVKSSGAPDQESSLIMAELLTKYESDDLSKYNIKSSKSSKHIKTQKKKSKKINSV